MFRDDFSQIVEITINGCKLAIRAGLPDFAMKIIKRTFACVAAPNAYALHGGILTGCVRVLYLYDTPKNPKYN